MALADFPEFPPKQLAIDYLANGGNPKAYSRYGEVHRFKGRVYGFWADSPKVACAKPNSLIYSYVEESLISDIRHGGQCLSDSKGKLAATYPQTG